MGTSGVVVYLDSILLFSAKDSAMLTDYEPIQAIAVTGADGVTAVAVGESLQMGAEVFPEEADYPNVKWSVVEGDGQATIDENGLLSAVAAGTVTVVASAMDDSEVSGEEEVTITFASGLEDRKTASIHLYPNPAGDYLRVSLPFEEETAQIFSSTGQLMRQIKVTGREVSLDIHDLPTGVYIFRAGNATGRFVK
jgi:hypothetical protein